MPLSDLISRQKTMEAYIKEDSELARKLLDAGDSIELKRKALKNNILDSFLDPIIDDDNYSDFVDNVVSSILDKFPDEVEKKEMDDLGLQKAKEPKKTKKTKAKKLVKKNITQVASSGKTYKRSYNKWQSPEKQFIKTRINAGFSASETRKEFINYFGNDAKTKSAINTQFYRIKNRSE